MDFQKFTNFFKTGSWGEPAPAELTLFLAKVIGLYLIIMGLYLLIRPDQLKKVVADFAANAGLQSFGGIFSLILGLLIVVSHNVWIWNWPVIITIFGYLGILKGICRLFCSEWDKKMMEKMGKSELFIYSGVIWILIGLFLAYQGFWK